MQETEMKKSEQRLTREVYEDGRPSLFYVLRIRKGEHFSRDRVCYSLLAFVLEGEVEMSMGVYVKEFACEGQMLVVHKGDNGYAKGLKDAVILLCSFDSSMALCNGLSLGNATEDYKEPTPEERQSQGLPRLEIKSMLMTELKLIQHEVESNLLGYRFMEFKRYIIVYMLRTLYNKEELFYMFRCVRSDDFDFRDKVLHFYTCDINAQELCAKMEMSTATFNRRFKRAFGMPCGEWLNSKRQVQVLMDLKTTDLSVKEIAGKYNLTPNYLTDFCKRFLGDVPVNLR